MALDYAKLAAVATRLIDENGREFQLRRSSQTLADPARPWGAVESDAVASDELSITVTGVFLDSIFLDEPGTANAITGLPEPQSSRTSRLLVGPEPELPAAVGPDWYATDGTLRWEILRVVPVRPGPTLVYHAIELEG